MIPGAGRTGLPLLLAVALAGLVAGCGGISAVQQPEFREVLLQGQGSDKMLLIDINGPITNQPAVVPNVGVVPGMTARIRQELELAFDDPRVRGILLRINSGGGTLTDSDIIYHSLMEFKRSKEVKIVAALGDLAASGALYVAMAADEIYAHPTTVTGSIGVILPHIEYSELMDKLGIRSDPVRSGEHKDLESPFRRRTEAEQEMLQQLIDDQHDKFLRVIRDGRKRMPEQQLQRIADGRLISAQQAKSAGLIDEVGYLDDAYERLSRLAGFPTNRLVRYANPWITGSNIYSNAFPIEFGGSN